MKPLLSIIYKYLPLLLWCVVIFLLSNQDQPDVGPTYWTNFVAKKLAHIVEYGILGLLSYRAFGKSKIKALIFVLLYAISDEIHQSLVPGREPSIRDILIDLFGGFVGLWIIKFLPRTIKTFLLN